MLYLSVKSFDNQLQLLVMLRLKEVYISLRYIPNYYHYPLKF
jgi:hypothetical protein